jgi:hypothetical protein
MATSHQSVSRFLKEEKILLAPMGVLAPGFPLKVSRKSHPREKRNRIREEKEKKNMPLIEDNKLGLSCAKLSSSWGELSEDIFHLPKH